MPRDKQGWRVAPAPDGRGTPEEHKPTPPHRQRWFWIFLIGVLALNWLSVLMFRAAGEPRVKVPFSPYFLQQLQAGEVRSISSKGATIEGTFATKLRYTPSDQKATPTTLFSTQVPSFWTSERIGVKRDPRGFCLVAQAPTSSWLLLRDPDGPKEKYAGVYLTPATWPAFRGSGRERRIARSSKRTGLRQSDCVLAGCPIRPRRKASARATRPGIAAQERRAPAYCVPRLPGAVGRLEPRRARRASLLIVGLLRLGSGITRFGEEVRG